MHALATWLGRGTSLRALVALLAAWCALASTGAAHAFDWTVEVTPGGGLYPVLALSQGPAATPAGTRHGLVIVRLAGSDLPARVAVEIASPGLHARLEQATTRGPAVELRPPLEWDLDALRQLRQPRDQVLEATLRGSDGSIRRQRLAVRLHPLDEAPYFVREDGHAVDLGWIFAAYVDPGDPVVDAVLARARQLDPAFDRGRDAAADLRRAGAVWAALEQHGLRYADGDPAIARGPVVWSQRVRRPAQVWREGRANCIDASVLLASVFERIGLQPAIVLVPGHAFAGFRGTRAGAPLQYLETTVLGMAHAGATPAERFRAARRAGQASWQRAASRLDGRHGPDYALVDIGTARAYGIIPPGSTTRAAAHPSVAAPAPAGQSPGSGSP
jgi:hypothetical protein